MGAICGIAFSNDLKSVGLFLIAIILLIGAFFIIGTFNKKKIFQNIIRYLKIILNKKVMLLFLTSSLIFSIYSIYLNYTYTNLYKTVSEKIRGEAIVISNEKQGEYYKEYTIKGTDGIVKNKKFLLYTYVKIEYGDKIKIDGAFYKPEEARNYKGYNYKKNLQTNKIYGTIKQKDIKVLSKNNVNFISTFSNNIRNKIINNIKSLFKKEEAGLLIGITLGDKRELENDIIENFKKSNLAHMLAISGTHLSYIILGLTYIIGISKINKKSGYVFIVLFLILFLFLTNFSVSVIRACIMVGIILLSKILYRKSDIYNTLAIAVLIILLENPYKLYSLSFGLSFLGTIGVIFVSKHINNFFEKIKIEEKISKILSVPISAYILILPITISSFNTISLTFLISNIITMPLFAIGIIGGFVVIIVSFIWFWFSKKLSFLLNIILKLLIIISEFFSKIKISNIYVVTPSKVTVIIYYFIIAFLLYLFTIKQKEHLRRYEKEIIKLISKYGKKILIATFVLIVLIEFPYLKFNGKLKIFFIDVGQRR